MTNAPSLQLSVGRDRGLLLGWLSLDLMIIDIDRIVSLDRYHQIGKLSSKPYVVEG